MFGACLGSSVGPVLVLSGASSLSGDCLRPVWDCLAMRHLPVWGQFGPPRTLGHVWGRLPPGASRCGQYGASIGSVCCQPRASLGHHSAANLGPVRGTTLGQVSLGLVGVGAVGPVVWGTTCYKEDQATTKPYRRRQTRVVRRTATGFILPQGHALHDAGSHAKAKKPETISS
jgi:hypothetical protein